VLFSCIMLEKPYSKSETIFSGKTERKVSFDSKLTSAGLSFRGFVLPVLLGQAKLIIRSPFQGFQNSMRAGGHFSLFIMTKILRNSTKKLISSYNNEIQ